MDDRDASREQRLSGEQRQRESEFTVLTGEYVTLCMNRKCSKSAVTLIQEQSFSWLWFWLGLFYEVHIMVFDGQV